MKSEIKKILKEAMLTLDDREDVYGNARDMIYQVVKIRNDLLAEDDIESFLCNMIALKLSRENYKHSKDNIIDVINYLAMLGAYRDNKGPDNNV